MAASMNALRVSEGNALIRSLLRTVPTEALGENRAVVPIP